MTIRTDCMKVSNRRNAGPGGRRPQKMARSYHDARGASIGTESDAAIAHTTQSLSSPQGLLHKIRTDARSHAPKAVVGDRPPLAIALGFPTLTSSLIMAVGHADFPARADCFPIERACAGARFPLLRSHCSARRA